MKKKAKTSRETGAKSKEALDVARAAGARSADKPAKIFPMLTLASLQKVRDGMKADIDKANGLLGELEKKTETIKADSTRNLEYQNAKIKEIRDAALPAIAEVVRTFAERLERVVGAQRYWKSKALVLSRQNFDADPVRDSAIRRGLIAEFAITPAVVLQLAADAAKMSGSLAVLWQAYLAGQRFTGKPGWGGISLDDVVVAEQDEALATIEACRAMNWTAHNIYALASGTPPSALDRLAAAREYPGLKVA